MTRRGSNDRWGQYDRWGNMTGAVKWRWIFPFLLRSSLLVIFEDG